MVGDVEAADPLPRTGPTPVAELTAAIEPHFVSRWFGTAIHLARAVRPDLERRFILHEPVRQRQP
jgi:hypothetical protein